MRGTTHLQAGLTTAVITGASPINVAIMLIGSILPDIDKGISLLGRYNLFAFTLSHRGITHSLVLLLPLYYLSEPLAIGMATHIILDMLNPTGVTLFWPIPFKVKFPIIAKIRSGGVIDWVVFTLLLSVAVYFLFIR